MTRWLKIRWTGPLTRAWPHYHLEAMLHSLRTGMADYTIRIRESGEEYNPIWKRWIEEHELEPPAGTIYVMNPDYIRWEPADMTFMGGTQVTDVHGRPHEKSPGSD